jgi:hypothetical protein
VKNRGKLLEDELPSGIFQRLTSGTPVSTEGFSGINPGEQAGNITYYHQIVSRVEEVLQCSFRVKRCPIMRAWSTCCDAHK